VGEVKNSYDIITMSKNTAKKFSKNIKTSQKTVDKSKSKVYNNGINISGE
jgi:hypothetical protein